jgi:hypothetical protein
MMPLSSKAEFALAQSEAEEDSSEEKAHKKEGTTPATIRGCPSSFEQGI